MIIIFETRGKEKSREKWKNKRKKRKKGPY